MNLTDEQLQIWGCMALDKYRSAAIIACKSEENSMVAIIAAFTMGYRHCQDRMMTITSNEMEPIVDAMKIMIDEIRREGES